jgi:hypothetical protein
MPCSTLCRTCSIPYSIKPYRQGRKTRKVFRRKGKESQARSIDSARIWQRDVRGSRAKVVLRKSAARCGSPAWQQVTPEETTLVLANVLLLSIKQIIIHELRSTMTWTERILNTCFHLQPVSRSPFLSKSLLPISSCSYSSSKGQSQKQGVFYKPSF